MGTDINDFCSKFLENCKEKNFSISKVLDTLHEFSDSSDEEDNASVSSITSSRTVVDVHNSNSTNNAETPINNSETTYTSKGETCKRQILDAYNRYLNERQTEIPTNRNRYEVLYNSNEALHAPLPMDEDEPSATENVHDKAEINNDNLSDNDARKTKQSRAKKTSGKSAINKATNKGKTIPMVILTVVPSFWTVAKKINLSAQNINTIIIIIII